VVAANPSEKSWSSSVRMMKFPIYAKVKNVPNHQPERYAGTNRMSLILARIGCILPKLSECIRPGTQSNSPSSNMAGKPPTYFEYLEVS